MSKIALSISLSTHIPGAMTQQKGLTNEQRRQMRAFSANRALRPSQRQCIVWFQTNFDRLIQLIEDFVEETTVDPDPIEESPEIVPPSASQALAALSTVVEFIEGQETFRPLDLRYLADLEGKIACLVASSRVQHILDRWLS